MELLLLHGGSVRHRPAESSGEEEEGEEGGGEERRGGTHFRLTLNR